MQLGQWRQCFSFHSSIFLSSSKRCSASRVASSSADFDLTYALSVAPYLSGSTRTAAMRKAPSSVWRKRTQRALMRSASAHVERKWYGCLHAAQKLAPHLAELHTSRCASGECGMGGTSHSLHRLPMHWTAPCRARSALR